MTVTRWNQVVFCKKIGRHKIRVTISVDEKEAPHPEYAAVAEFLKDDEVQLKWRLTMEEARELMYGWRVSDDK